MRGARVLRVVAAAALAVVSVPGPAVAAEWAWPLAGPQEVTRPFAPPATRYGAGHRGADLPAAPGAPVRAAAAGRVTYAGLLAGRGVVVVSHGALRTTYEPVTAEVRVGQPVALGEVLGQLEAGHAGCPAAACLHWGLRRGEEYLDPVRLVRRGPVRLLPLDAPAGARVAAAGPARAGTASADGPGVAAPDLAAAPSTADAARERAALGAARSGPPGGSPQVEEPSWSVRAADAPLAAGAVVALVLGIGLLARPRPTPPAPVSGGGVAAPAAPTAPAHELPLAPPATLLDLDEARARRQVAS